MRIEQQDEPAPHRYRLAPLAEVEIVDDWQVLGLLATGSKITRPARRVRRRASPCDGQ